MNARPIPVAVVGLGYFSQFHIDSWRAIDGAALVAATDTNPERRDMAAAAQGVPVVDTLDALLARDPQVIDIVAPPPAHAALITAALAPGRTIICQKPFCTSLAEARDIAARAAQADTRLLIHENFRFQPWYRTLQEELAAGRLGQVWSARFALRPGDGRGPRAYLDRQPAFQTMPRLLIHETAVHFIDLFRWLFGDIAGVYADIRRLNPAIAGEDAGLMVLDHAGGVQSVFDGNRLADHISDAPRRTMGELVIEGEGGKIKLDGQGRLWHRPFQAQSAEEIRLRHEVDPDRFGGGCVEALNRHVVAALASTRPFENLAEDYLPVIALTDLAYASAQTGCKLPAPSRDR